MCDNKVVPDMTGARPDSAISLVRFDPAKEIQVLRGVVLRDALLALLAEERRKFMTGGGLCMKTVLQALVETREVSLQVVEAITRWRFTLIKPESFDVRGENYVLTMATDVGFLATGLTPIKEAFGMEFGTGNPFALPCATSSVKVAARVGKPRGETARFRPVGSPTEKSRLVGRGKVETMRVPVGSPTGKKRSSPPKGSPGALAGSGGKEEVDRIAPSTRRPTPSTKVGSKRAARTGDVKSAPAGDNAGGVKMLGIGEGAQPLPSLSCIEDGGVEAEEGVEGESSSRSNPFHEVLSKLGDFDVEQRERLEKAQRFIETEVARSNAKPREPSWWGYHRWTARPWVPNAHLSPG